MTDAVATVTEVVPLIEKALHNAHPGAMLEFPTGWLGLERMRQVHNVVSDLLRDCPAEMGKDMQRLEPYLEEQRSGRGLSYRTLSGLSGKSIVTLKRAAAKGILRRTERGRYTKVREAEAIPYCFAAPLASRGKQREIDVLWRLLFRDSTRFASLTHLPSSRTLTDAEISGMSLPPCVPAIPARVQQVLAPFNCWDIRLLTAIRLANPLVIHDEKGSGGVIELFYTRDLNPKTGNETPQETLVDHHHELIHCVPPPDPPRPELPPLRPWQIGEKLLLDGTLERWASERKIDISDPDGFLASFIRCPNPNCKAPFRGTFKEGIRDPAGGVSAFWMRCQTCGHEYESRSSEFLDCLKELRANLVCLNEQPGTVRLTDEQIQGFIAYELREYHTAGDNAPDDVFMEKGQRRLYRPWGESGRHRRRRGMLLAIAIALGTITEDQAGDKSLRNVTCSSVRNALRLIEKKARVDDFNSARQMLKSFAREIEENCWADLWFVLPATFARRMVDVGTSR